MLNTSTGQLRVCIASRYHPQSRCSYPDNTLALPSRCHHHTDPKLGHRNLKGEEEKEAQEVTAVQD